MFGAAADDGSGGQGQFLMRVSSESLDSTTQAFKDMTSQHLYLLGMGLATFKDKGSTLRPAISKGEFTVHLMFRPTTSAADKKSVADALYIFGLLGALGSRARHGMGSISLTTWAGDERQVPTTRDAYKKAIQSVMPHQLPNNLPPFTALSAKTRIDISAEQGDVFQLLSSVGSEQQMYRSFGQNGMVSGKTAERKFQTDHDLMLSATEGSSIFELPKRVVFGLPHNYFFSSTKGKADVNYAPDGVDARRGSPLLLHVHRLGDDSYLAVNCLMPAQFLPEGGRVRIKAKGKPTEITPQVDWAVITSYLDRFEGKETIHVQR